MKKYQKGKVLVPILIVVAVLAVVGIAFFTGGKYLSFNSFSKSSIFPRPSQKTNNPDNIPNDDNSFIGTVKLGSEIEGREYCPEGIYLVADKDKLLSGQTSELLLRETEGQGSKMVDDQTIIGKKVSVVGKHPTEGVFCEALVCGCDDYILVTSIKVVE